MPIQRAKPRFVDSRGTVTTNQLNIGQIGGRRNLIVNGAMEVAQRGTSSTSTGWGYYTVDRMNTNLRAGAGTMSQYTLNDELPPFVNAFKFAITSGSNNGQPIMQQKIEDSRKFKNRQVTLSFFAKASKAITVNTAFDLLWANADNFTTAVDHSITTDWQRFTSTVTLPNPGGSYNSTYDHLYTRITTPLNDTFDFYITGLQVEYGGTATEYEHKSFGEELALCQRYFNIFGTDTGNNYENFGTVVAFSTGNGDRRMQMTMPTTMRVIPSVAQSGNFACLGQVVFGSSVTIALADGGSKTIIGLNLTGTQGDTTGDVSPFRSNNDADAFISFDAEI